MFNKDLRKLNNENFGFGWNRVIFFFDEWFYLLFEFVGFRYV